MLEHITLHLWCSKWRSAFLSCWCFIWTFRLSRIRSCVYSNNFKALNILTYFFRLHFGPRFLLVFVRLCYDYFSKFFSCTTYCSDFWISLFSGCLPKVTYLFVASYRLFPFHGIRFYKHSPVFLSGIFSYSFLSLDISFFVYFLIISLFHITFFFLISLYFL